MSNDENEVKPVIKKRGRKPKNANVIPNEIDNNITIQIAEVKKKRGRKPKPKPEFEEVKIPKKRGRKPKIKTEEELAATKVLKKRGRRPKDKTYTTNKNLEVFSCKDVSENENIILHIPVKMDDIDYDNDFDDKKFLTYNPNINEPTPYIPSITAEILNHKKNSELNFTEFQNLDEEVVDDDKSEKSDCNHDLISNTKLSGNDKNRSLNDEYEDYKNQYHNELEDIKVNKEQYDISQDCDTIDSIPDKTDVHCWWCCHQFEGRPLGLPYRYVNNKFYTTGIFCSLNCCCSYNFNDTNDNIWEKYNLLNLMYRKMYNIKGVKVKMSPPRQVLKKFGGTLTIEEFRKNNQTHEKDFKILMPPIINIIPQIEEIINLNTLDKSIPVDKSKIKKADMNLKLKRNKPILNSNRTLESYMGK